MSAAAPPDRWGAVAKLFHWLTAVLVIALAVIGIIMADMPLGVQKLELYGLHKSIGITVLTLTTLRLIWRLTHPAPPPLAPPGAAEIVLAKAVHVLLYAVLLAMPLAGWIMSSAANFSVSVFGLFTLPNLVGPDKALEEAAKATHFWLACTLGGLFLLHLAGALRHHVLLRDDTLRRMLPFGKLRDSGP